MPLPPKVNCLKSSSQLFVTFGGAAASLFNSISKKLEHEQKKFIKTNNERAFRDRCNFRIFCSVWFRALAADILCGKFEVSNVLASWADMMKKNVERRGATRSFGPRM